MQASNRSALKEWASVEDALATGGVALLLRKGGIYEGKGEFRVEHREFWIFPTRFHQNPDELRPEYRPLLEGVPAGPQDEIPIRTYAVVQDAYRVERLDALERLAGSTRTRRRPSPPASPIAASRTSTPSSSARTGCRHPSSSPTPWATKAASRG